MFTFSILSPGCGLWEKVLQLFGTLHMATAGRGSTSTFRSKSEFQSHELVAHELQGFLVTMQCFTKVGISGRFLVFEIKTLSFSVKSRKAGTIGCTLLSDHLEIENTVETSNRPVPTAYINCLRWVSIVVSAHWYTYHYHHHHHRLREIT